MGCNSARPSVQPVTVLDRPLSTSRTSLHGGAHAATNTSRFEEATPNLLDYSDVPGDLESRKSDQKISLPRPTSTDRPRSLLREPPAISSEEEPTISPRPTPTHRPRSLLREPPAISSEEEPTILPRPTPTHRPRPLWREPPAMPIEEEPTISPRPISTPRRRSLLSKQSAMSEEDESDDYDGPVHLERPMAIPGSHAYMVDADTAHQMQHRKKNNKALAILQSKPRKTPVDDDSRPSSSEPDNTFIPHFAYMKWIGCIPNFDQSPDAQIFNSDKCELLFSNVVVFSEGYELVDNRKKYLVFEDNFQSSILDMLKESGQSTSFERLKNVCMSHETKSGMVQHEQTSNRSYKYFLQKKKTLSESQSRMPFTRAQSQLPALLMDDEEARASAFVLSFYTGSNVYQKVNRGASIIARHGNGEATTMVKEDKKFQETSIIMYYLIKALSHIDFYWGVVSRAVTLDSEELKEYKPGNLVTWIQFSSSAKGDKPPEHFASRNTIFFIYSLTGRSIKDFSNFPEEEEVLFPPHSTFLVNRVEKTSNQTHIYMRQVELGLCKCSVMWVDDHIFHDWWENKIYMEKAATVGADANVHFIPKSSTETAISFLLSGFGERLRDKENFRIVADMTREDETQPDNAGARLLYEVHKLGFNCPCLVFAMDEQGACEKVNALVLPEHRQNITVTSSIDVLNKFINFIN